MKWFDHLAAMLNNEVSILIYLEVKNEGKEKRLPF